MEQIYEIYKLKVRFTFCKNFTYLIVDSKSKEAAIIDPAWELNHVINIITKTNAHLKCILLTHSHLDHVNLVKPLLKRFNPKAYMHRKEINYYNFRCNNLQPIEHLDKIKIGNTNITTLFTPGHTAGSCCFLLKKDLFTGDTLFTEGCGICNGKGGSPKAMFNSLQIIKSIVDIDTHKYPAHSFGKAPGQLLNKILKENIYLQFENEANIINFRMRNNQKSPFSFR
jgi:glyoxylase-like metal-dependent hydrolase (beta-lactamase superfamily II)